MVEPHGGTGHGSPTDSAPVAELWPSTGAQPESQEDAVQIKIYIITGRHGIIRIPEAFCRECDLFVRAADQAARQVELPVNVRVFSWWTRFFDALRYGGYHPPIMVVGRERLCQGHTVPTVEEVIMAILDAAESGSSSIGAASIDSDSYPRPFELDLLEISSTSFVWA